MQTCEQCRFWKPIRWGDMNVYDGECRRRAPKPSTAWSNWARTKIDDWCGEFQAKEKEDE